MEAKIKNNKPYCPKCEVILNENSSSVELVATKDDIRFYLFTRRCFKCNSELDYCSDLDLEKRYEVNKLGKLYKVISI